MSAKSSVLVAPCTGAELLDRLERHPGCTSLVPSRLRRILTLAREAYERELGCLAEDGWCPPSAALVVVAAGVGRPDEARCAGFACGMEMVWQAVVQHRSAGLGRAQTEWILSSDFLLSRALSIFIFDGDEDAMGAVVNGALALAESVLAGDTQGAPAVVVAEGIGRYWGACCRVGAIAGGLSKRHADRLESMGRLVASTLCGAAVSGRWEPAANGAESDLLRVLAGTGEAVSLGRA